MPPEISDPLTAEFGVTTPEQRAAFDEEALAFVAAYEDLLATIELALPNAWGGLVQRAYVVNEERPYLNSRPGFDTLVALLKRYQKSHLSADKFSELLHLMIEASDRIPRHDEQGRCAADIRLYLGASSANLIDNDGFFQPRLTLVRTPRLSAAGQETLNAVLARRNLSTAETQTGSEFWEVAFNGDRYPCTLERQGDRIHLIGPKLPLRLLVGDIPAPIFLRAGRPISPAPLIPPGFTLKPYIP
jgi:hypothetical protein